MTTDVHFPPPRVLAGRLVDAARERGGLLLCTDFDGTLAPIASGPERVRVVPAAQAAVLWLSRDGAAAGDGAACPVRLAVVTSRDADDVVSRIELGPEAVVVGCSGLETLAGGVVEVEASAVPWLPGLAAAARELEGRLQAGALPGARLERKRCGVVLHTRGLPMETDAGAVELAAEVAAAEGLAVAAGKRAFEVRPPLSLGKADAVRTLRRGLWERAALCVAGDDLPDVGMLDLAAEVAGGTAIAVADVETPTAVLDAADAAVEGPWGWAQTLHILVNLLAETGFH